MSHSALIEAFLEMLSACASDDYEAATFTPSPSAAGDATT
jgi:hypothetical protein